MQEVGWLDFMAILLKPSSYFLHKHAPISQLHEKPSPFLELWLHFLSIPSFGLFDGLVIRSVACPLSPTRGLLKDGIRFFTRVSPTCSFEHSTGSSGQPKEYGDPPGKALSFGSPMASLTAAVASLDPQLVPGRTVQGTLLRMRLGAGRQAAPPRPTPVCLRTRTPRHLAARSAPAS